jgi:hypothetical protein
MHALADYVLKEVKAYQAGNKIEGAKLWQKNRSCASKARTMPKVSIGMAKPAGHLEPGEKKRPNVLKLCRHIQDLPGAIVQYGDPEYNGLACWVSDDEVTVAMKMKVRKSYTTADLARLSKLPEDRLQKALDHGSWAGLFSIDHGRSQSSED